MTREIKFRAWDKDKNRMSLPFSLGGLSVVTWGDGGIAMPLAFGIGKDRLELMQYAGLKDKNGVEIYEGDIVYDDWDNAIGEIVFQMGAFCFIRKDEEDNDIALAERYQRDCGVIIGVIGNIYENPELLEIEL